MVRDADGPRGDLQAAESALSQAGMMGTPDQDAACQLYVLRAAGIPVRRVELMHFNR